MNGKLTMLQLNQILIQPSSDSAFPFRFPFNDVTFLRYGKHWIDLTLNSVTILCNIKWIDPFFLNITPLVQAQLERNNDLREES